MQLKSHATPDYRVICSKESVGRALAVTNENQEILREKLAHMRSEHRDLDDVIARISFDTPFD